MGGEIPVSPELADCIQRLRAILDERIRLVNAVIAVLVQDESAKELRSETTAIPESVRRTLPLMLQAVGSSTRTIVNLSGSPSFQTRDCYSIARSVLELCVNVCFIVAVGPDAADRAQRHARQKAFRDLERESRIGASVIRLAFSGRPDPASVPGLPQAMSEFTARSDREKAWVDGSVDDRIVAAGDRFGKQTLDQLHFARFMIYRHSSEMLHGTLFGVLYFFGLTQPKESWTQADAAEYIGQQHMMLLMGVGLALEAVVGTFDAAYGFAQAKEQSQHLSDSLMTIPFFTVAGRDGAESRGGEPEGVA